MLQPARSLLCTGSCYCVSCFTNFKLFRANPCRPYGLYWFTVSRSAYRATYACTIRSFNMPLTSQTSSTQPHLTQINKDRQSGPSYAKITKSKVTPLLDFNFPSAEQGIIFPYISDAKIYDYLVAVNSILNSPKQIIAASRISNLRVAIFLAKESLVDVIIEAPKGLIIDGKEIRGRRMKNKPTKLILSNVSPTISNSVLEKFLTNELKLNLASKISLLRVNPQDELFGHVISYRRQVYINDLNPTHLPSSFLFQDNDTSHRIFLTGDESTCFKCHSRSHKAEDCPAEAIQTDLVQEDDALLPPKTSQNLSFELKLQEARRTRDQLFPREMTNFSTPPINSEALQQDSPNDPASNPETIDNSEATNSENTDIGPQNNSEATNSSPMDIELSLKRSLRSNSTTTISDVSTTSAGKHSKKKQKKSQELQDHKKSQKVNADPSEELQSLISTLLVETPDLLPPDLSQEDVLEFTNDLLHFNTKKSLSNLNNYTESPENFLSFLSILHDKSNQRNLKNRITRLLNLAHDQASSTNSDADTHLEG